jgi:hypothetical protein
MFDHLQHRIVTGINNLQAADCGASRSLRTIALRSPYGLRAAISTDVKVDRAGARAARRVDRRGGHRPERGLQPALEIDASPGLYWRVKSGTERGDLKAHKHKDVSTGKAQYQNVQIPSPMDTCKTAAINPFSIAIPPARQQIRLVAAYKVSECQLVCIIRNSTGCGP